MPDRNPKHFGREIEPYLDKLFHAAYRLTHDRADAQELVQDVCVRAFENHEQWAETSTPLGWLMRIQYNLFVDGVRRERRAKVVPLCEVEDRYLASGDRFDLESRTETSQRIARVQLAWRKLNRDQRALLALSVEGYTLAEMKEITGMSIEVLNARLYRARRSLMKNLEPENPDAESREKMEVRR